MTMKTQIILFAWLCSGLNLLAQPAQLTREAYRDRVENYSQVLKHCIICFNADSHIFF